MSGSTVNLRLYWTLGDVVCLTAQGGEFVLKSCRENLPTHGNQKKTSATQTAMTLTV